MDSRPAGGGGVAPAGRDSGERARASGTMEEAGGVASCGGGGLPGRSLAWASTWGHGRGAKRRRCVREAAAAAAALGELRSFAGGSCQRWADSVVPLLPPAGEATGVLDG